jgi:nicotinamide-nucleotide amidase
LSARAGILVTGTEVLTGTIHDRNGPWVSAELAGLGIEVAHMSCVGDRREDLAASLRFLAGEGMDLIVTTGGLGPTADDLTAEVVADFAGRELEVDPELERRIEAIVAEFAKRMRFDPDGLRAGTRKQALVPRGAIALDPSGTAPGLVVPAGETVVLVLPGPPRELQAMWPAAVAAPAVAEVIARGEPVETRTMKMFGIPESTLAKTLREVGAELPLERLEITTCLRRGAELEIDVRHRPGDEQLVEGLFAGLRDRHGAFVYTERGESIDEIVASLLAGRRLAVAESCTGGLLAGRLTDRPGSSAYLAGGVVAYADDSKRELLGVPVELLAAHGAVSPEAAEAMARGAIERFGADLGVAVTGIAGPGGGTDEKPVGYVCFCALEASGRKLELAPTLPGRRSDVRERSVAVAMHVLRRLLLGEELPL